MRVDQAIPLVRKLLADLGYRATIVVASDRTSEPFIRCMLSFTDGSYTREPLLNIPILCDYLKERFDKVHLGGYTIDVGGFTWPEPIMAPPKLLSRIRERARTDTYPTKEDRKQAEAIYDRKYIPGEQVSVPKKSGKHKYYFICCYLTGPWGYRFVNYRLMRDDKAIVNARNIYKTWEVEVANTSGNFYNDRSYVRRPSE